MHTFNKIYQNLKRDPPVSPVYLHSLHYAYIIYKCIHIYKLLSSEAHGQLTIMMLFNIIWQSSQKLQGVIKNMVKHGMF